MVSTISVGPPQIAQAGSKINPKEKKEASGELFSERFEKALDKKNVDAKPKNDLKEKKSSEDKEAKADAKEPRDKEPSEDKVSIKDRKNLSEKQGTSKKQKRSDEDQQAISMFMASVENEIEIPPQKIEEALAQIKNPSNIQTVDQLVEQLADKLDLSSSQEQALSALAEKSFADVSEGSGKSQLLTSLVAEGTLLKAGQSLDQSKLAEVMKANPGIAKEEAQALALKEAEMQKAIQNMNDRFWMKNQPAAKALPGEAVPLNMDQVADQLAMLNQGQAPTNVLAPNMEAAMKQFETGSGGGGSEFSSDGQGSESSLEPKTVDGLSLTGGAQATAFPKEAILNELKLAPLAAPMMTAVQKEENLQEVLSQASYLVKNGGGEMTVRMHPEGLGQVELKVLLQDGKVNLEMVAENKEVKKLIESQLTDLKMGLAAQKLSVEHVKVDVVAPTNTENSSRLLSDLNQQQQNNQTKQFWNQFNDNFGSQARKSSYFEMKAPKEMRRESQPLAPVDASASSARVKRFDGKGSEINLVA